jgi:VanZ family protein
VDKAKRKRVLRSVAAAYVLALVAVSLLPSGGTGPLAGWDTNISPGVQNLLHVPAYGLLVWLVARPWGLRKPRHLALAAAVCAAFGGMLEVAQAAIPGRLGSLEDTLLNAAGAAGAVPVLLGLRRLGGRKNEEPSAEASSASTGPIP